MAPQKIIIDTDPGQDDAVAILLALASPEELEILGITVVAGNVPLAQTVTNACAVCELGGHPEMRVFAGCDRPLRRPPVTAEHIHGETGLDGAELPAPTMDVAPGHAVDFIIDTVRREEAGSVTLCTLGPLTNVAMALNRAPELAGRIARIVMMGGSNFALGNRTPTSEFNVLADPDAAKLVFGAGIELVELPLDVTHQALTTPERNAAFAALGTPVGTAVAGWTGFYQRHNAEKYGEAGAPLHDPCVIAYLLRPELFSGREINVEIETESPLCLGMTVADYWFVTDRTPNVLFLHDIDAQGYFDLLTERLARL